jgi:hypothetical protein
VDQSRYPQSDLKARNGAGNEASIAVHIKWVQQDIRAAFRNVETLRKALSETTDASKIERYTAEFSASRQYISELEEVLMRYAGMASVSACHC